MICYNCLTSPALQKFVLGRGVSQLCDSCGQEATAVNDEVLIAHIGALFDAALVPFEALPKMTKIDVECGADHPILEITDHIDCNPPSISGHFNNQLIDYLTQKLVDKSSGAFLVECFMVNDGELTENGFSTGWSNFIKSIENGRRFFNKEAKVFLDDLFNILIDKSGFESPGIIKTIDHQAPLYRARVVSSVDSIRKLQTNPSGELGPIPPTLASDQRMSPAGISIFYGALDRNTCISEIRPLVGDFAVSAEFRAMSELKLIDLNKLPECDVVKDIYDEKFVRHSHAVSFFKEMVFQMSRPARREINNHYLPTQFIFEYLRVKFGGVADGILYSSVQQDQAGICIALFPESSVVSPEPLSKLQDKDALVWEADPSYALFYVPDSLRYHRVRGVTCIQEEDSSDFKFTASENLQLYTGTRF